MVFSVGQIEADPVFSLNPHDPGLVIEDLAEDRERLGPKA